MDFDARRAGARPRSTRCWRSPPRSGAAALAALLDNWQDGAVKLLRHRRRPAAARRGAGACSSTATTCRSRSKRTVDAARRSRSRGISADGGAAIAIAPHLVVAPGRRPSIPSRSGDRWRTSRVHLPKSLAGADLPRRLHRRRNPPGHGRRERLAVRRPGAQDAPGIAAGRGVTATPPVTTPNSPTLDSRLPELSTVGSYWQLRAVNWTASAARPPVCCCSRFSSTMSTVSSVVAEQVAAEVVGAALVHVGGLARVRVPDARAGS